DTGRILDCPGGASGFTAHACARGATAVAADPVYARRVAELEVLGVREAARGTAHSAAGSQRYCWDFFGGVDGHRRERETSARIFGTDIRAHPGRYIAASLPALPFAAA